jgi:predicted porin
MKKSLLALAVLGTIAACAQAQTNVTIYGIVDAGFVREFGTGPDSTKLTSGIRNGSRLGFKGTEDLGGGLSAIFQLENGFNVDTGTLGQGGLLFGRQAYVGLSSRSFGTVTLGRQYSPIFTSLDAVDPFGTGLAGASYNLISTVVRVNNSLKYTSANYAGFSGEVLYGFGEVPGDTAASRTLALGLNYATGPVTVTFAHNSSNNATDTNRTKLSLLGGTFDLGVAKIHAAFEVEKDDAALDSRDYLVGASAPLGNGSVMASYIRRNDRSALNRDADQIALGYVYNLSKRTNLYTSVARIKNDNGATFTVGNATEGGTTNKAFNVGVQHRF